jgi:hypothetical protein
VDLVKLIRENAPPDSRALPSDVVPVIEYAIRGYLAKPVESTS